MRLQPKLRVTDRVRAESLGVDPENIWAVWADSVPEGAFVLFMRGPVAVVHID